MMISDRWVLRLAHRRLEDYRAPGVLRVMVARGIPLQAALAKIERMVDRGLLEYGNSPWDVSPAGWAPPRPPRIACAEDKPAPKPAPATPKVGPTPRTPKAREIQRARSRPPKPPKPEPRRCATEGCRRPPKPRSPYCHGCAIVRQRERNRQRYHERKSA